MIQSTSYLARLFRNSSVVAGTALALVAFSRMPVWAQELPGGAMAQQSLRPYWHVFIAYAIAIVLVLLWVLSIGRRLKDVEEKLQE